jgi:hypothetical protein
MESLQLRWDDPDSDLTIRPVGLRYMPTAKSAKGQTGRLRLQPRPVKTNGCPFNFSKSLFAGDRGLIFDSPEDLVAGTSDLHAHFARFGLLMHAGTRQADSTLEKSKIEAIYFPAFPNSEPDVLPEPFDISALHHIHFTREFCYLGSFLTTDLSDDRDITVRIRKATQQVGGLTNFFLNKAVELFTKKLIFLAIPVNTVLYGYESWALKAQHISNKLRVFFHRSICRILGINMRRVEHNRIKNEHIRNCFWCTGIIDSIRPRQFRWLLRQNIYKETKFGKLSFNFRKVSTRHGSCVAFLPKFHHILQVTITRD